MVGAAEHVTINLEEVEGFPANAEKFAVLVEDNGVAKPERRIIFIIAEAYVVAFAFWTGSIAANVHMPQAAIR